MSVQRLLQRKSILSSTKQEFMTNDPSFAKCVMSSMSVTQTTTITWECINQRKKQQDCLSVKSVTMKPIKNRTWIGTFWRCTMKRKIPTNPKTDLVLTVENLSCNKGILQDTRRYTEKETRTTLLSPQVFCFVWSFPLFSFSPTGEVQQPVKSVKWGVNFGTYAANALRFLRIPGIWRNTPKEGTPRK